MLTLKKLLIFLAGLLTGVFPPEAVAMLMEPPPGMGLPPRHPEPAPLPRQRATRPRHDRRPRFRRAARPRHH